MKRIIAYTAIILTFAVANAHAQEDMDKRLELAKK